MQKNAPIGVLDSGVGGLSVLKCLQAALPQEDFIYVGDTARTPYGPRSEAEVRRFVGEIIDYLDGRGVKLVVIACNTLTVLGVDTLKGSHAFEIVGMSKGAQLVLAASCSKKIGVFATEFTISSGAHKAAILAADAGADVYPQACPKFVPLIEGEQFWQRRGHVCCCRICGAAEGGRHRHADLVLYALSFYPKKRSKASLAVR